MRSFARALCVRAIGRRQPTAYALGRCSLAELRTFTNLYFFSPCLGLTAYIDTALHTTNSLDSSTHRMLIRSKSAHFFTRLPAGPVHHGHHRLQRTKHCHAKAITPVFCGTAEGVEDFHCQLPRGKNFAFVTVLNSSDGQRFLSYFGAWTKDATQHYV